MSSTIRGILRAPIPGGYPGRRLLRSEVDNLKKAGVAAAKTSWRVWRAVDNCAEPGRIFYPQKLPHGQTPVLANTGILVSS